MERKDELQLWWTFPQKKIERQAPVNSVYYYYY